VSAASRIVLLLGVSLGVGLAAAGVSPGASSGSAIAVPFRAFSRPAAAGDALPYTPGLIVGQVLKSRLVATYADQNGSREKLFVYEEDGRPRYSNKKPETWLCVFEFFEHGHGTTGCAPIRVVPAAMGKRPLEVSEADSPSGGRYLWGIAANTVRNVVLTDATGARHPLTLSPDNAFIYKCVNTCAGSIDSYGRGGRLLSTEHLRAR
jgi:hypothetical protein